MTPLIYLCFSWIFYAPMIRTAAAGPAAKKAAVHTTGVQPICELSGELKGVSAYVQESLRRTFQSMVDLDHSRKGIIIRKSKPNSDHQTLTILENYVIIKSEHLRRGLQDLISAAIQAAVAGAYAGGRVDEVFHALAGFNPKSPLTDGTNDPVCLIEGGASATFVGSQKEAITQDKGKDNAKVKKCFLPPGDEQLPKTEGVLNFQEHLKQAKAGSDFLTTAAPTTAGCPLLDVGAANKLILATYGPAEWKLAGGLITFKGSGSTALDNSAIPASDDVIGSSKNIPFFKTAADKFNEFKTEKLANYRRLTEKAFKPRSLEELGKDADFKRALFLAGAIKSEDDGLAEKHTKIYDRVLNEYEEAIQAAKSDDALSHFAGAQKSLASIFLGRNKNQTGQGETTPSVRHELSEDRPANKAQHPNASSSNARDKSLQLLSLASCLVFG